MSSRSWLLSILLFALATGAVFLFFVQGPYLPRLLGMPDYWKQTGPFMFYMDQSLHRGHLPLWNPLYFCGQPFAGHPLVNMTYPPNLLRSLLTFDPTPFRTHVGLAILVGLHTILAGVGASLLSRANGIGPAGSATAGVVYAFSASFIRRAIAHPGFVWMAAWLPIVLLLLHRSQDQRALWPRLRYALGAGLVLGCAVLAGQPQVALYMGVAVATYAMGYRLFRPTGRTAGETLRGEFLRDGVTLAVLFATAGLVAAAELLPMQQFTTLSGRAAGTTTAAVGQPLLPIGDLLQAFLVYPGPADIRLGYRAAGAGAVLLALGAAFHPRRRFAALNLLAFLVLLDCSLGPPLPVSTLVAGLAPFRVLHPDRAFLLLCLPLGLFAGMGVDAVASDPGSRRARVIRSLVLFGLGLSVMVPLVRWAFPHDYLEVSGLVVLLPLITWLVMLSAVWVRRRTVLAGLLPLLILLEIWTWVTPTIPAWMGVSPYPGELQQLVQRPVPSLENRRAVDRTPNVATYGLTPIINGYDPLHLDVVRRLMAAPRNAVRYRREVRDYEALELNARGNLFLKRLFWLAHQYVDAPLPAADTLFPSATTVYLNGASDVDVPEVAAVDVEGYGVAADAERIPLSPSARTARTGVLRYQPVEPQGRHGTLLVEYVSTGAAEVGATFRDPSRGIRQKGLKLSIPPSDGEVRELEFPLPDLVRLQVSLNVESDAAGSFEVREAFVLLDAGDEGERIEILRHDANRVELRVRDLPGPRVLTFIDAYYPGWNAYVDRKPVAVHRANDAFKAVSVPRGTHEVVFVYKPWRARAGMVISFTSMLGILLVLGWSGFRNRSSISDRVAP